MSFAIEVLLENLLDVGGKFVEHSKSARRYAKQLQELQDVLNRFDRKTVLDIAANKYADYYSEITKYLYLNVETFSGGYVEIEKEELQALRDVANNWAEVWQIANDITMRDKVSRRYLEPILEAMRPLVKVIGDESEHAENNQL